MLRKTLRIDYSNGINEIIDKSLLPEKFATVLDNVDIRSGFSNGFKEPIFYKVVSPSTTKKIFKYRGKWVYSDEYRDYVYQFIEDQERILFTSDGFRPRKIVNDSDMVPLGTNKPKSSVTVGFNEPLTVQAIEIKPKKISQGKLKAQLYRYRISALTQDGWQHPSDEYGYNQLEEDGEVDITFDGVKGASKYSIYRDSGDGYERIGDSESTNFVDSGENKKDSTLFDDIASQLDKADHTYVYSYERDVNGMVDESGLSPISNTFNTTKERVVIRNVLSDGYFDQDNVQNISSGFTVYPTASHNPKITVTKMSYIENIKHVQFTTSTPHKLKTDDLIVFAGPGWANPLYYKKTCKVIFVSPTIFNIANLSAPTDLDSNNNVEDGCYIQIARTRILMPQGSDNNLYDGDSVYFYAKDNTIEGQSSPQNLYPINRSEVYVPPSPTLTIASTPGSLVSRTYRYRVIAVSEYGEFSQPSIEASIVASANQSINVAIPSAPTSGFSDFSHWLLLREYSNQSYTWSQNLKGDDDDSASYDTNAKFSAGYIYNDKDTAGHWSQVAITLEALESPLTVTQTNANNMQSWYDESLDSHLKLEFNGQAKTNASGNIVNIANIGTMTFDEFGEPDYPFNAYTIKLTYSYTDFVDGTYGPTFVGFEYSVNDGKDWYIFATDDFENSKKYLDNNKREIEQVIYNNLSPVSPAKIKIRARIALTNISQGNAAGNNNRVNPYTWFKNLERPGTFSNQFKEPKDISSYPSIQILEKDEYVSDDDYDVDATTPTGSGAITAIRAIRPLAINTDFDVEPLVDGTYTKALNQTGTSLGTGGTVTFTVAAGVIIESSVTVATGGSGYLLDDALSVNMNYPSERLINSTFYNPVFMVTGVQATSGSGGNVLTASSTISTGAKVGLKIYTILIKATYDKETQVIDGLFKARKYDSSGVPLSTGYIEIERYTPYWDNSATLTSTAKWVPRNGYYKYWNIYRTGTAGTYQLVDKVPIHESLYFDSKSTAYLGENPTSYYTDVGPFGEIDVLFNTPPKDLTGLTEHFGMYFGISGNAVRWTPMGTPDAFPDTFMVTLPYKPLALKSYANSLMILCEDSIYRLEGGKPTEMSLSKTQVEDGCIAPHSVQATSFGLIYLSKRGLMLTNGQVAKCISEGKVKPSFFTATSKQTEDFKFWWIPTVGSYFYANLVSGFGYDNNKQQISKFRDIRELTGINNTIRSFVWNGKYFMFWSNAPSDDFSGHTAICIDLAVESLPITTLGINAVDIISDENDNVYALFANQGNGSQENYNEFKSQVRQGIYDISKFKDNPGLSIWQLFAGDNFIPMTIRTGYKRIDSNMVKNGVQQIGNPFDTKVYDYIDFYGNGNVVAKAYIDGDYIISGEVVMEQTYKKPRRLNLPAGKRTGYNLDIEVYGSTSKVVMEIAYRLPEED
jgi:hypothetical protein